MSSSQGLSAIQGKCLTQGRAVAAPVVREPIMENKVAELQDKAERKGREYFFLGKGYDCLSSMLLALTDVFASVNFETPTEVC